MQYYIVLQALCAALQSNTNDKWDMSNTCVRLLQKPVPLPGRYTVILYMYVTGHDIYIGFTLFIGEKEDMAEGNNTTKLTNLVMKETYCSQ